MKNIVLDKNEIGISRTIHDIDKIIFRSINEKLSSLKISHVQALILIYLLENESEEVFQKTLEIEFGLSNPTVTASLNSMESKGLLVKKKSEQDGRFYSLFLTEEGRAIAPKCSSIYEENEKELNSILTKSQITALEEVSKIIRNKFSGK